MSGTILRMQMWLFPWTQLTDLGNADSVPWEYNWIVKYRLDALYILKGSINHLCLLL